MSRNLVELIKESVIQGRVTKDDEGMEEGMVGKPGVTELVEEAMSHNIDVRDIISGGLTAGMEVVGQKFEEGEYFIPDMLASAEAVGVAMELLEPHIAKAGLKTKGKVLLVTVKGDLHDIGKNIVAILLRGAGYTVKDLGNDVEPQEIVKAVIEDRPDVLGLSALLISTMGNMSETLHVLTEKGLRDQMKIIVGGAPVTEDFARSIGADGYGADGFAAVKIVESFYGSSAK
jgi:5-methyltetrahydrofolate--homocysteine methyltransferase